MRRKVWHLVSNRWNSAITEYALSAARAFNLQGHNSVFSPLAASPAEKRARTYGLDVRPFSDFSPRRVRQVRDLALEIKPDAIFTYGGQETFLTKFLPRKVNCPVVRFRGEEVPEDHWHRHSFARWGYSHVSLVLTPGMHLRHDMQRLLPEKKVSVVQLGIDRDVFRRREAGSVSPYCDLLIVGRLDPIKGHAFFLGLFAELLKQWSGWPLEHASDLRPRLHIIGEPANISQQEMEAAIHSQGLELGKDVLLTCSRISNLPDLMTQASLGVVPSLGSEQICRVAQEFLLCGTPVFVSGAGALEEVLFNEAAGVCYEDWESSGEGVIQRLRDLILRCVNEDESARADRATAARKLFSLQAMGENLSAALAWQ